MALPKVRLKLTKDFVGNVNKAFNFNIPNAIANLDLPAIDVFVPYFPGVLEMNSVRELEMGISESNQQTIFSYTITQ